MPKADDMPLRGLPLSISEDAMATVALALYGADMATAKNDGRMVGTDASPPTIVVTRSCEVYGKPFLLTVTVSMEPAS